MASKLFRLETAKFRKDFLMAIAYITNDFFWEIERESRETFFNMGDNENIYDSYIESVLNKIDDKERYNLMCFYKNNLEKFLKESRNYARKNKKITYDTKKLCIQKEIQLTDSKEKGSYITYIYFHRVKEKIEYLKGEIEYYEKYEGVYEGYEFTDIVKKNIIWLGTRQDLFFLFEALDNLGFVYPDNISRIMKDSFVIFDNKKKVFEKLTDETIKDYRSKVKNPNTILKPSQKMRDIISSIPPPNRK